jgi:hypothetical protein
MTTSQQYPGWTKDPDGQWRNPRYPRGSSSRKEGLSITYDEEINGAVITVDGHSTPLSFWELSNFLDDAHRSRVLAQAENARLWKEKEQVLFVEEGIEPAVYVRGRLQNPDRGRRRK